MVLTYHSVGSSRLGLEAEQFDIQLKFLARHTRVVDLTTLLLANDSIPEPLCSITFDDGYAGVYSSAFPLLMQHNLPATVFLTTNAIGQNRSKMSSTFPGLYPNELMLTWEQVREMSRFGVTAGAHLQDHLDLTRLQPSQALQQLRNCKHSIEDKVGMTCASFAYPWGKHNRASVEWVREAEYELAVTTIHSSVHTNCNRFRIPRMDVRAEYQMDDFVSIVRGDWDFLAPYHTIRNVLR